MTQLLYCLELYISPTGNIRSLPFTFIRLFGTIGECQDYIRQNVQKQITLFISSIHVIDVRALFDCGHLRDIYVFCMLPRHKSFVSRYLQDIQHKVRSIFMFEQLEYQLILHGVAHCKRVADENQHQNHTIKDMALRDGKRLAEALFNYFANQTEQSNEQYSQESMS